MSVWVLTAGMEVASVHCWRAAAMPTTRTACWTSPGQVRRDGHGLDHAAVQLEPAEHADCDDGEEVTYS